MKCPGCHAVELRRVRNSKTAVFCPDCGWTCINGDGKIKVVGRPPKTEAGTSQASKPTGDGGAAGNK